MNNAINTTTTYKKLGWRLFNVHKWSTETEDFRKVWVGITLAGFSIDVTTIFGEAKSIYSYNVPSRTNLIEKC